jgi:glycosyltransferase involved in cell wall biosynthesis
MTGRRTVPEEQVTAIVVARNRAGVIGRCLSSLTRATPQSVIVVDGCSTDETASVAEAHGAIVVSDGGAGLAAARNLGAERADTEWIVYVDSDVEVEPDTIRSLLSEALASRFDAVQARLEPIDSRLSYWQQGEHWRRRRREQPGPARAVGCQATLVRRRLVLDVGFDPLFSGAGEDGDFFVRASDAGAHVAFSATAIAHHQDRRSLSEFVRQRVWHGRGLARTALRQGRRYGSAARDDGSTVGLGILSEPRFMPFMIVSVWGLGLGFAIELLGLARDRPLRQRLRTVGA